MLLQKILSKALLLSLISFVGCTNGTPDDSQQTGNDSEGETEISEGDTEVLGEDTETPEPLQPSLIKLGTIFGYDPVSGLFNPTLTLDEEQSTFKPGLKMILADEEGEAVLDQDIFDEDHMCVLKFDATDPIMNEWDQTDEVNWGTDDPGDDTIEDVHHYGFEFSEYELTMEGNCVIGYPDEDDIILDEVIAKILLVQLIDTASGQDSGTDPFQPLTISVGVGSVRSDVYATADENEEVSDEVMARLLGGGISVQETENISANGYTGSVTGSGIIVGEDNVIPVTEGEVIDNTSDELLDDSGRPVRGAYQITVQFEVS